MPWLETYEHNVQLHAALTELAVERGALERLAGAINTDEISLTIDDARRGRKHKQRQTIIAESTLVRWQAEGLARVMNAQPHKKRIVYEFLERAVEFRTTLYCPETNLPAGFMAYAAAHGQRLAQPFQKDLRNLDGAFTLYRPAWTTPERCDRVLVSRLEFVTKGGFTRFREEQDFYDDILHGAHVHEIDDGAVTFVAGNIVLLGIAVDGDRAKLFVANNWFHELDGAKPVAYLKGSMVCIAGRHEHPQFPFVAVRSRKPFSDIETGILESTDPRLDPQTRRVLGLPQHKGSS